jgi:Ca2+-transporting ATPase
MVGALTLTAFVIGSQRSLEAGRTMAFTVLALSQLVHSFNMRSNRQSIFSMGFGSNRYLLDAVGISALLVFTVLGIPFLSALFKLTALNAGEWTVVAVLMLAPLAVVEAAKRLKLNTTPDEYHA